MSTALHSSLAWKSYFSNWNCIKITNIYEVVRPFYYVAKFYGFAPFQMKDQQLSPEHGVTNTADWIIIWFNLFGYVYILALLFEEKDEDTEGFNGHIIVRIFQGILYVITNFMSIVCMISTIIFRKNLLKVANDLYQIDKEVSVVVFLDLKLTFTLSLAA